MLAKNALALTAFLLALQVLAGCAGPTANSNVANANATSAGAEPEKEGVKDTSDELAILIKFPFEPEDLAWREFPATGDQRRRVLAVFQLLPEDSKKLTERSSKIRPGKSVSLATEKWFPTELTMLNEMNSDEGIPATSYAADEFFNAPFTEGSLSRVDNTDFFVLELFAK